MSQRIQGVELAQVADVTAAPVRTRVDRTFGLPTGLYVATVALYVAFMGVMTSLFLNPSLAIPLVVMVGFIVLAFGLAGKWSTMQPDNDSAPLSWGQFSSRGIETLSGHLTAGEASAQVLILPVLILVWGVSIAVIVAFV